MSQWASNISLGTLVLLYLAVVFKPLWPCADYLLHKEYFANVLCENQDRPELQCEGKCVLMQKIQAAQEQPAEELPLQLEVKDIVSLVFWEATASHSLAALCTAVSNSQDMQLLVSHQTAPPTPPPRT